MHELSLAVNLIEIVEDQAAAHGATRVREVVLVVGRLSCVEGDALKICFESVRKNTIAESATLKIEYSPGRAQCPECVKEVAIDDYLSPCPECGHYQLEILSGREIRVRELEVD
jgi:hydrogenase nickel incorporation protein HypA/HybF